MNLDSWEYMAYCVEMNLHMLLQIWTAKECLIAERARVRGLPGVDSLVASQVWLLHTQKPLVSIFTVGLNLGH